MRICIVLGPFLPAPPGKAGAVERIWAGLASNFVAMGHEVTVQCKELAATGQEYPKDSRIRYVSLPGESRTGSLIVDLLKDFRYSRRARRSLPATDVVVCNTFWLPCLLGSGRPGVELVTYNLARFPKGSWHMWLYRRTDRILAVSSAVSDAVGHQYPRLMPKTVVVPNPIATEVFRYTRPPAAPDGEPKTVLYTGRVHPEKGVHMLVEACSRLAIQGLDVRVRIIGESEIALGGGGPGYVERLRTLANGVTVEFVPAIYDRPALAEALRSCDVYCYPSLAEKGESFGVAPLEAMAVGCPVVVSSLDCFSDFLDPGSTGLIFDHRAGDSVARLSDRLQQLLADRPAALAMGRRAAQRAEAFGYPAIARRYIEVFEEAILEKGARFQ